MHIKYLSFLGLCLGIFSIYIVGLIIWRFDSPYQFSVDWDIFAHLAAWHVIAGGHFSLWLSSISDTFLINAYTPLFAILLGIGKSILFFLDVPAYLFWLDSIYYFATIIVAYFFAMSVSKSRTVGFVSACLAAYVFESVVAQTSLFFVPQGLTALLGIVAIIFWLRKRYLFVLILLLVALLMHYVIGGLIVSVTGLLFILDRLVGARFGRRVYFALPFIGIGFIVLVIILGVFITFNPFDSIESTFLSFKLVDQLRYFARWYSLLFLFYPVGLWYVFRGKNNVLQLIGFVSLILIGLTFIPIPYVLKFYTLARYPVHLVMAFGFAELLSKGRKLVRVFSVGILLLALCLIFYLNTQTFKEVMIYGYMKTTLSQAEFEAAEFLRINYGNNPNVLLVSDPATQHVLEGLSGVNTQGGPFAGKITRQLVDQIYPANDGVQIREKLFLIRDKVSVTNPSIRLLAISGRFIAWQQLDEKQKFNEGYNIWAARDLPITGQEYADALAGKAGFKVVFTNLAMVLLEVTK